MSLELCTPEQLTRWYGELPLGALVVLLSVDQLQRDHHSCFEHDGQLLAVGVVPTAPFGRATDADRERVAAAISQLNAKLADKAWRPVLIECHPAGVFIPEAEIHVVVKAPQGTIPGVWLPVVDVATIA